MSSLSACILFCFLIVIVSNGVHSAKCPEVTIHCLCSSPIGAEGGTLPIVMNEDTMYNAHNENCVDVSSPSEYCSNQCSVILPTNTTKKDYEQIRELSNGNNFKHPIKLVFPPADNLNGIRADDTHRHERFRRFPKTCNDTLKPLKNALVICFFWPNYVTCDIKCTYGHALREDGQVQSMSTRSCRESESYWSPKRTFPVCEPYINCKTHLIHPGSMKCKSSMVTPSYCDISCLFDAEHDEVALKRYTCEDDKYAKTLPHCAAIDSHAVLIDPPNINYTRAH